MGKLGVCLANLLRRFAEVLLLVVGNADPDCNSIFRNKICCISLKLLNCSKDHTWSCWRKPSSCLAMEFHRVSVPLQMLLSCYTFLLYEKVSCVGSQQTESSKSKISFMEFRLSLPDFFRGKPTFSMHKSKENYNSASDSTWQKFHSVFGWA